MLMLDKNYTQGMAIINAKSFVQKSLTSSYKLILQAIRHSRSKTFDYKKLPRICSDAWNSGQWTL